MLRLFDQKSIIASSDIVKAFRTFLNDDWKKWMIEYPESATQSGFSGQDNRWSDNSPEGIARRKQHLNNSLLTLKKISRDLLPAEEKVHYDMYLELLETAQDGLQHGFDPWPFRNVIPLNLWMPLTQMNGVHRDAEFTLTSMPCQTLVDYENIMVRLEKLPQLIQQTIALLQEGLKRGYSPPRLMLRDVPKQIFDLIPTEPLKSVLLKPFAQFPSGFSEDDCIQLITRATSIYAKMLKPAFFQLHEYITTAYLPACRNSIAASALPEGEAAYKFLLSWHTTTTLTPQKVHEMGLAEVKQIHAKMNKVIAATGFKGNFHAFTKFLRTDPRFYYDNAEDLVNGYRVIAKKIDPELLRLFEKLPRLPYGICKIPDYTAASQTTAYYQPGALQTGRPGWYSVNTYNLSARPKWEMEVLTAHEAVPGHHLQCSLAQEKFDMPEFRKKAGYSAFVEGWGLYSESLGEELGLYKDPYSKFGQLSYEMWRAVRLVVDTGIHAMGWTREQAIEFFRENSSKSNQDITVEVDRYIVWPAQALAYKLGQLKISELRKKATEKLNVRFDVRKFHDAVLENGAVPLSILETHLEQWMAEEAAESLINKSVLKAGL